MTNLSRDPKGYYIALGIAEDADAKAVKAAYRAKAKRLHPDFNPSPIATKQFHRLHEAYETLSDPAKRAAYDHPWRTAGQSQNTREEKKREHQQKKAEEKRAKAETRRASATASTASASASASSPSSSTARPSVEEPALCKCGKVTAQPRYVVFDQVWGRLKRVQKRTISGIYCRSCADRAALRASLITWLAGWWAWPSGPRETVKALVNNIRGGRKPAERNARLLLRQARAFRARGETELARSAAEQALVFAGPIPLKAEIESFLQPLSGAGRAIKDRWNKPGWAPALQIAPLAVLVVGIAMATSLSAPAPLSTMARDLYGHVTALMQDTPEDAEPAEVIVAGRVYSVARDNAPLRTGPDDSYRLEAMLKMGTLVLATETNPDGTWLRVETSDRGVGFMRAGDLTTDVQADPLDDVGGFGANTPAKASN